MEVPSGASFYVPQPLSKACMRVLPVTRTSPPPVEIKASPWLIRAATWASLAASVPAQIASGLVTVEQLLIVKTVRPSKIIFCMVNISWKDL